MVLPTTPTLLKLVGAFCTVRHCSTSDDIPVQGCCSCCKADSAWATDTCAVLMMYRVGILKLCVLVVGATYYFDIFARKYIQSLGIEPKPAKKVE